MPAIPGESLLTTLFADVHYYFGDPTATPVHHRFDRRSYVYIYHNPVSRQVKFEIANHAGTPDQDAFSGYLHSSDANVHYSYLQPGLFTVDVPSASSADHAQWHLPAFDERNQQKYLYKIRALDIYMWTEKDAATFLSHLKAVVPSDKLVIRDAPASTGSLAEHRDSMSPVVQQLERTAIAGHVPQRAASTQSSHHSLPGPPTPAAPSPGPVTPAPMAYNPAAPAAPEPISHREKTPPPPDAASGTGLSSKPQYAGCHSAFNPNQGFMPQPSSYGNSFSGPSSTTSGLPPPPPGGPSANRPSELFAGPPSSDFAPRPSVSPISPVQHQQNYANQSFGPSQTQYTSYPQQTPNHQAALPPTPPAPAQQQQQQQSAYGYTSYDYSAGQPSQTQSTNQQGAYTGGVHSQTYRPTESEAQHGAKPSQANQTNTPASESKVSKKMNGLLKKL